MINRLVIDTTGVARTCPLLALFGRRPMFDLSPLCAPKRKSANACGFMRSHSTYLNRSIFMQWCATPDGGSPCPHLLAISDPKEPE